MNSAWLNITWHWCYSRSKAERSRLEWCDSWRGLLHAENRLVERDIPSRGDLSEVRMLLPRHGLLPLLKRAFFSLLAFCGNPFKEMELEKVEKSQNFIEFALFKPKQGASSVDNEADSEFHCTSQRACSLNLLLYERHEPQHFTHDIWAPDLTQIAENNDLTWDWEADMWNSDASPSG